MSIDTDNLDLFKAASFENESLKDSGIEEEVFHVNELVKDGFFVDSSLGAAFHDGTVEALSPDPSKDKKLTQSQAARIIQSSFRRFFHTATGGELDEGLIHESRSLMTLSKKDYESIQKLSQERKLKTLEAVLKSHWEEAVAFADELKDDHYVFLHGSSFDHGFFVDMKTFLGKEHQQSTFLSTWDTQKRFRSLEEAPISYQNTDEYFDSELCAKINAREAKDIYPNSINILSCDGYLENQDDFESAYYFSKENKSILPAFRLQNEFFKEYISDWRINYFAGRAFEYATDSLSRSKTPIIKGQGRVYVIAIPKETLKDPDTCYLWRSHPFGRVCGCTDKRSVDWHKQFIQTLEQHQKGKVKVCKELELLPQYRILTANLERDFSKKILTLDSLTEEQKHLYYEGFFWPLAHLVKQCQRLESITHETPVDEVISILLRTRFDLDHWKRVQDEMMVDREIKGKVQKKKVSEKIVKDNFIDEILAPMYTEGLRKILKEKAFILLNYLPQLSEELPTELFDKLKGIGAFNKEEDTALSHKKEVEDCVTLAIKDNNIFHSLDDHLKKEVLLKANEKNPSLSVRLYSLLPKPIARELLQNDLFIADLYASCLTANNNALLLKAIEIDETILNKAPEEFAQNRDFSLEAIRCNENALEFVSEKFISDIKFIKAALRLNPTVLKFLSDDLRSNKELVLIALRVDCDVLEYVDEDLQDDPEIQAAARGDY